MGKLRARQYSLYIYTLYNQVPHPSEMEKKTNITRKTQHGTLFIIKTWKRDEEAEEKNGE
jgi:hypothetical protein